MQMFLLGVNHCFFLMNNFRPIQFIHEDFYYISMFNISVLNIKRKKKKLQFQLDLVLFILLAVLYCPSRDSFRNVGYDEISKKDGSRCSMVWNSCSPSSSGITPRHELCSTPLVSSSVAMQHGQQLHLDYIFPTVVSNKIDESLWPCRWAFRDGMWHLVWIGCKSIQKMCESGIGTQKDIFFFSFLYLNVLFLNGEKII